MLWNWYNFSMRHNTIYIKKIYNFSNNFIDYRHNTTHGEYRRISRWKKKRFLTSSKSLRLISWKSSRILTPLLTSLYLSSHTKIFLIKLSEKYANISVPTSGSITNSTLITSRMHRFLMVWIFSFVRKGWWKILLNFSMKKPKNSHLSMECTH